LSTRNSFCGKANNVLCYFTYCDPLVKSMLLRLYCSDFYGCMLWDSSHPRADDSTAWHKGLMRALGVHIRLYRLLSLIRYRLEMNCSVRLLCFCRNVFVARIVLLI